MFDNDAARAAAITAIVNATDRDKASAATLSALAGCSGSNDPEYNHECADSAIVAYLNAIGETAIAAAFDSVPKWFA